MTKREKEQVFGLLEKGASYKTICSLIIELARKNNLSREERNNLAGKDLAEFISYTKKVEGRDKVNEQQ